MIFQYTSTTIPLILVTILLLWLASYAWDKRQIPGAKVFILLMIDLALWALTHLGEWVFVDPDIKLLCLRTRYLFIATVPILWLAFTLETTGRGRTLQKRNILLLLVIPAINLIGVWTNDWHLFFWREISVGYISTVRVLETVYGPWFWFHASYSYLILLAGTVVLIQAYQRAVPLFRSRLRLLLLGSFSPWVANAITISEAIPAWEALRMATIEGAHAIGLGEMIGSLEPGKQADLILVDLDQLNLSPVVHAPIRNIVPNLVYAATGHEVDSVMVAGQFLMRGREILTADETAIRAEAQAAAEEISRRVLADPRHEDLTLLDAMQDGKL